MKEVAFHLGMASLFTHELDALPNHEWRLMPLLQALPDASAMPAFVAAHVPLFALLTGLVASTHPRTRRLARLVIAGFLVIHAGMHALSMGEPAYEFSSALSNLLIFGAAAFGALYLILDWKEVGP